MNEAYMIFRGVYQDIGGTMHWDPRIPKADYIRSIRLDSLEDAVTGRGNARPGVNERRLAVVFKQLDDAESVEDTCRFYAQKYQVGSIVTADDKVILPQRL